MAELASVTPIAVGAVSAADGRDFVREVYREHHDRLVGLLVRKTGDRGLAEDLAHDTFVRFVGAVDRLDRGRPVWPYLRAIASNLVIDRHTRDSRQVPLDVEEALVDEPDPCADVADVVVLRSLLEQAIGRLSPRQQVAVELRCFRGWDGTESAEFLGIDPTALGQLLFRARRNLRVALERSGTLAPGVGATRTPTA